MEIDFVVPWVDAKDTEWQKKKVKYEAPIQGLYDHDRGVQRYRDTNTLKYLLRSIEQYCPWYRTIHIITNGQKPSWVDIEHPKVNLITHEELYYDSSHLPTFNSASIEMNLSNLKGVSEHFVYLNDDLLFFNPISKDNFFKEGKPVDFLIHGWFPRNIIYQKLRDDSSWVKALNNSINLINSITSPLDIKNPKKTLFDSTYPLLGKISNFMLRYIYKRYFFISHWHNAQPYRLSLIKEVYEKFKQPMTRCSENRFRSYNDLTPYLYRYYHLATEQFYPSFHKDFYYANITSMQALENILNDFQKNNYNFISIYDNFSVEDERLIIEKLSDYLEMKFPKKASFEYE